MDPISNEREEIEPHLTYLNEEMITSNVHLALHIYTKVVVLFSSCQPGFLSFSKPAAHPERKAAAKNSAHCTPHRSDGRQEGADENRKNIRQQQDRCDP